MIVFYDGGCGLCHGFVRFVLRHGPPHILFAPLPAQRPNTLLVRLDNGLHLDRSDAVLAVIGQFGGPWFRLARVLRWIPRPVRDAVYRMIAFMRNRVSKMPAQNCPIVPPELRSRFLQ